MENIIEIWKEKNIDRVEFIFSCGGDSMNDTQLAIFDKDDTDITDITDEVIYNYFDDKVYNEVDFYVDSDGHYMGEQGTVTITLYDDESNFHYSKSSSSEWYENYTEVVDCELTENEASFIENYVSNIEFGSWGGETINYKKDFIITSDMEKLVEVLHEKLLNTAAEAEYVNSDNIDDDSFGYTTDLGENDIPVIKRNEKGVFLTLSVSAGGYVFTEE
jgi:hypothetical protein